MYFIYFYLIKKFRMKIRSLFSFPTFILALLIAFSVNSQKRDKTEETTQIKVSPKLVVGIVVDQMRYDYLTRFYDHCRGGLQLQEQPF